MVKKTFWEAVKGRRSIYALRNNFVQHTLYEVIRWKGKTYHEALNASFPEEVHRLTYDDPDGLNSRFIVNETSSFRSSIQWVHDYAKSYNFV